MIPKNLFYPDPIPYQITPISTPAHFFETGARFSKVAVNKRAQSHFS